MTASIVLLEPRPADLLDRLKAVAAAGDVPLVGDARWPPAQRESVLRTSTAAKLPNGTAWATLTSGSGGLSRIVLRSAVSWSSSFATVTELLGIRPGEAIALPAPPSSSLTLFSLAHALDGGPHPLLKGPEGARFETAVALHGTPQSLRTLLDTGSAPRLRTALVGGSRMDPALRERAETAGIRVISYYGAAELSFVAFDQGDGLRAFPGVELRVRDGVLWVRSPFVALGYAGASGPLQREGAWATVGDRAELNDGRLRLLGRGDDAILSASATIVPEEVETVLRSVPGVRDAVVFGIPREPVGALVAALIEADGTGSAGLAGLAAELRRAATLQLAPAHRPRRWFAGELPRTSSGKPARADAVRRALAGEVPRLVD
jgi:acyl-CoA synthetase (AMP-forming)/AMP-acid ligase II